MGRHPMPGQWMKNYAKGTIVAGFWRNMQINLRMSNIFCNFAPDFEGKTAMV